MYENSLRDHKQILMHSRRKEAVNSFRWFATVASTNHALNYVINSLASSILGTSLGGMSMGLNWLLNAFAGLLIASPVVKSLGFKTSMIISLWVDFIILKII